MMNVPKELKYTPDHEWVKVNGNEIIIGITDYAQSQLGDIVFIEVPQVGEKVSKGSGFSVVESVKAVSDIYSPVDGVIVKVNESLEESPELVNSDPYQEGWIAVIELTDNKQLDDLLDSERYTCLLEAEGGE